MLKKIICLLLVIFFCFALCGCTNSNSNIQESEEIIDPIEQRKEMLNNAFIKCCMADINFSMLSSDCSSLVIDTNPDDKIMNDYEDKAMEAIILTNSFLNLPASVGEKMAGTRALDGMQSQNCGDFTVSWTYHPDNGLRVIYEVNY